MNALIRVEDTAAMMRYRPEIDGLRAVAIVPVVLFHAGFSLFSGGFVGVDVFFVISGFLITSIISEDLDRGTFSFKDFYARRARRILPALILVILCSSLFAWLFMWPNELREFGRSVIYVCIFLSNMFFWHQSGYFETSSELKPLLHTWSLSVEEQFYIVFPIALTYIWAKGKNRVFGMIILVAASSLLLSEWMSRAYPELNFYGAPTRAWEFLSGSLCSFVVIKRHRVRDELLSMVGLAAILGSVFWFDAKTPFPSLYAAVPIGGSCLVLLYGVKQSTVGRLLSLPLISGIGLVSYSAYLWHQPLFTFTRLQLFFQPDNETFFVLCLATFGLAYVSWKFVEQPWRQRTLPLLDVRRIAISIGTVFGVAISGLGLIGFITHGFSIWYTNTNNEMMAYEEKSFRNDVFFKFYLAGSCFGTELTKNVLLACGRDSAGASLLIWGDSNAAALAFGFRDRLKSNIAQLTIAACPPLKDFVSPFNPNCKKMNDDILHEIGVIKPKDLVLHARWTYYDTKDLTNRMQETLNAIRAISPETHIIIVGSVPVWKPSLARLLLRARIGLNQPTSFFNKNLGDLIEIDRRLKPLDDGNKVEFVSAIDALCEEDKCRAIMSREGKLELSAMDDHHLTPAGSVFLTQKLPLSR